MVRLYSISDLIGEQSSSTISMKKKIVWIWNVRHKYVLDFVIDSSFSTEKVSENSIPEKDFWNIAEVLGSGDKTLLI